MSKAKVMRELKRLNPNARVFINDAGVSTSPQKRQHWAIVAFEAKRQIAKLDEERRAISGDRSAKLLEMARFVLDVDGDPSALEQLRPWVEMCERANDLHQRWKAAKAQHVQASARAKKYRYQACAQGFAFTYTIDAEADTLGELAEKLQQQPTPRRRSA